MNELIFIGTKSAGEEFYTLYRCMAIQSSRLGIAVFDLICCEVSMNHQFKLLAPVLFLVFSMLACSSSVDILETPVPATEQFNVPTEAPVTQADLLPHTFYYLDRDSAGLTQVYRLERDGKTQTQLTFEPVSVLDYDISLRDGSLVYEVNNQLILINADGSDRLILAEGPLRPAERGYYQPVFSPDGQTIAYADGGLKLYDVQTQTSSLLLADQPLGGELPPAAYSPDQFSPDGTRLLINIGHPPDSPWTGAIYTLATQTIVPVAAVAGPHEPLTCCTHYGGAAWSADSSSFYAAARVPDASLAGGELWKVDANSGAVTTLIPAAAGDGDNRLFYYEYKPFLAPDGQLYFFSAKFPESAGYLNRVPAIIVHTSPDDVINQWSVLRGDQFESVNEALWAPDASFVIVAFALSDDVYDGGRAEIVYFDGRPNVVLVPFAQQMKWGP